MNIKLPLVIFIMEVSGAGKSTIRNLVAKKLSIPFFDGDDFIPACKFYHTSLKNLSHD